MSHSFKVIVVKLSLIPHARINSSDKVYQASIESLKLHQFNIFIHHCRDSFSSAIIRDDPFQPKSINPAGAHQPDGGLSAEANYTLLLDNGWCFNVEADSLNVSWADISVSINSVNGSALQRLILLFAMSQPHCSVHVPARVFSCSNVLSNPSSDRYQHACLQLLNLSFLHRRHLFRSAGGNISLIIVRGKSRHTSHVCWRRLLR